MLKNKQSQWSLIGCCYATLIGFIAAGGIFVPQNHSATEEGRASKLASHSQRGGINNQRLSDPERRAPASSSSGQRLDFNRTSLLLQEHLANQTATNCLVVWSMEGCSACNTQYAIVQQLKREGYTVQIIKYEQNRELAQKLNIRSFPTCLVYTDGKLVKRFVGVASPATLKKYLKLDTPENYDVW